MKRKEKTISTNLTCEEYENLLSFLDKRGQSISEYTLMSLAVLLEDKDPVIMKRCRNGRKGPKFTITIRCSDCVFSAVAEFAQRHNRSKAEVVGTAISKALVA